MSRARQKRSELLDELKLAGRRLSTATIMFHQAVADRLGLNPTDHRCVDRLLLNGPLTAGELASRTGLTTGAITAALDRLERAGFVARGDDPQNRRRVIVQPVLDYWAANKAKFPNYASGSAGPAEAEALLGSERHWRSVTLPPAK